MRRVRVQTSGETATCYPGVRGRGTVRGLFHRRDGGPRVRSARTLVLTTPRRRSTPLLRLQLSLRGSRIFTQSELRPLNGAPRFASACSPPSIAVSTQAP